MKEQRWPGDYQTIGQEFVASRLQEQMGMDDYNQSMGHDYLAMNDLMTMDHRQMNEMEPSWSTQLDTVGMQPHAREYVERQVASTRSNRKFSIIEGQVIDHCDGIQFSGRP